MARASSRQVSFSLDGPKYDFYKFAKEWSGTACSTKECVDDHLKTNEWNQHGLWPNQWKTFNIPGCSHEAYNPKAFSNSQRSEIDSFWDGMFSSNDGFWSHEWSKHGTCWDSSKGDLDKMTLDVRNAVKSARTVQQNGGKLITNFFHTVYEIQKPLNFYEALKNANIVPDADKTYSLDSIRSAFQTYFKVENFDLVCVGNHETGNNELSEVRICLDLNYNVFSCPDAQTRCKNDISYPVHHAQ